MLLRRALLAVSWVLAAVSFADLGFAVADGSTLVFGPVLGAAAGWLAGRNGAPRSAPRLAVAFNAAVLAVTVMAIFTLGAT
jgi:hypothetical protein